VQKIILYYKFVPIKDPEAVRLWQQSLCRQLNLNGRIIIAAHGINGTLGGDVKDLKSYVRQTRTYRPLKAMEFKWSSGASADFPRLSVKVRPEIVTFGVPEQIKVNRRGIVGGGQKLKPRQLHELVRQRGQDVIFFDGRNQFEAAIGRFKNAIIPKVRHSRDYPDELKRPEYQAIKDKPIVTYCTGGIRCEVLSTLMKQQGFKEVYQLDGGIVKYGEEYADQGFWEGSLFVFDKRMSTTFSSQAKTIGRCSNCRKKTSNYENCAVKSCNDLILLCRGCAKASRYCPPHYLVEHKA